MDFAGITADQFTATVRANPTDEGVARWFLQTAQPPAPAELEEWNRMMLKRGPSTPEKQDYFNKCRDAIDPSRTDLTSWADLQDLEEGRPVPRREPESERTAG